MTSRPFRGTWAADDAYLAAGGEYIRAWIAKGAPGRMTNLTEVRKQGPEALLRGWVPDEPIVDRDTNPKGAAFLFVPV